MISLVIPMYNEEKIITGTILSVREYMRKTYGDDYEIIIVDDGSSDNCLKSAQALADKDLRVISYKPNRGKGCAVRTGILNAKGDYIFFTDCDLAYGLEVVDQGYKILKENAGTHIVIGSRKLHKDGYESYPLSRKILSGGFVFFIKILCGFKFSDSQSGIKGYKRDVAMKIFPRCKIDGFTFDLEVLMTAQALNYVVAEMPVKIVNHRESKVNIVKDSVKMFSDIMRIRKSIKKHDKMPVG